MKKIVSCLLGLATFCVWSCSSQAQCGGHASLDDAERAAFIAAAQGHREEVSVELLAREGCSPTMLEGLSRLGAKERFVDAKVGYARVLLPKEKVLKVPDLPGIQEAWAAAMDAQYLTRDAVPSPLAPGKTAPVPTFTLLVPRVARELPPDGPYFPAREAGLTQLWIDHPLADGRGVKVALFDDGLDLLHPALQEALDASGRAVPKVEDIVPTSLPGETRGWVQFGEPFQTAAGRFEAAGRQWTAPHEGTFRFGVFSTEIFFGTWFAGFSRGEPPAHVDLSVGVLWDEDANRVWVDTDGDGDFRNQKALGDYGETHDVDSFGSQSSGEDNRLPFGIKIDRGRKAVYLSLRGSFHATAVAGTLAANRLTGGLYDGSAPNAQLVDVQASSTVSLIPGVLASLARPDVDVLNRSGIFIAYGPAGALEEEFDRHVLDRATALYDKPISCLCFSANALSIDDYQSAEMLRRNRQTRPPYLEATNADARPDEDGLMNAVVAPSAVLATQSRYVPLFKTNKDGRTVDTSEGTMPDSLAPAGYWIGANPSVTIPFGAGVMADLISEARREHVRYNASRLVQAVLTSARLIPRLSTVQQGHGVINAAGAWIQLDKMSKADDPANPELTSFVIEQGTGNARQKIEGFWSDFPSPEGPHNVQLWVTRRGGYAGSRPYRLSLRANDGTFRLLARRVNLVQGEPAAVRFSFKVSPGRHLAFLQLIDATADAVMQEVPLTERSSVGVPVAPGVDQYRATTPPLDSDSEYVYLDPKVQAARFVMRVPNAGLARYSNRALPGFMYSSEGPPKPLGRISETKVPAGAPLDAAHHVGPMEQFESLIRNDALPPPWAGSKPHVYGIYWSNGGSIEYATPYDPPSPDASITGTVRISKYAVALKGDGTRLSVTNELADITGRVEFYQAKLETAQLEGAGAHAQAVLDRTLPAHLAQWRLHVSSTSIASDPADAYLFHCTEKKGCDLVDKAKFLEDGATLSVDDPREGEWRVIVRTRDAVTQSVSYRVQQALLSPDAAASEAADTPHAHGATWSVAVPEESGSALYAAFRIAGTPGQKSEKNGLRIAMTALTAGAP